MIPQDILALGDFAVSVYQSALASAVKSHTPQDAEILAVLAAQQYAQPFDDLFPPGYAGYDAENKSAENCSTCYFYSDQTCSLIGEVVATAKSALYLPKAEIPNPIDQFLEKDEKSILDKIKQWFYTGQPDQTGFKTLEEYGYPNKWVAWYTNPYEDREAEHFAEKSIENDVLLMRKYKLYPALWRGHRSATKHGQATWVGKIARFAVAIGHFDDTPLGKAYQAYYHRNKGKIRLSHGYYYDPEKLVDGTYHLHHTFEISTLRKGREANPYTGFNLGAKAMKWTQQDWKELVEEVGEELAGQIIRDTVKASKQLDQAGVSRKAAKPKEMDEEEMAEEMEEKKPPKKSLDQPVVLTRDDIVAAVTEGNKALTDQLGQLIGLLSGQKVAQPQASTNTSYQPPVVVNQQPTQPVTNQTPQYQVDPAQGVPADQKAREAYFTTPWPDALTAERASRLIGNAQQQQQGADPAAQFKALQQQDPTAAAGMFTILKALPGAFGGGDK